MACMKLSINRSSIHSLYLIQGTPPLEAAARRLFQQLATGLAYCRTQGLAHCSLHPRDLLMHGAAADGAARLSAGDASGLALKLHSFSAALSAATGGACQGADGGVEAAWLCTEQDPSFSAPEVSIKQVAGMMPR